MHTNFPKCIKLCCSFAAATRVPEAMLLYEGQTAWDPILLLLKEKYFSKVL